MSPTRHNKLLRRFPSKGSDLDDAQWKRKLLDDLRPGLLKTVHEEISTALIARNSGGPKGKRHTKPSPTQPLSGYEELARSSVRNVDETIESCLRWFDITKSSLVLDFVRRCADLFPARVYPAVMNRPDFVRIIVEGVQLFVVEQMTAPAKWDNLVDLSSLKCALERSSFIFTFGADMLELKERRVYLESYAMAYYHAFVIIDLFEPPNIFSSIPVADLEDGKADVQHSKIVDNMRLQAYTM
ncbi:hypothetical protein BDV98DRAFT_591382 [Pterulicium gracile]|uniref:Uncharacterized protein n=1 Tax=Pterulicium gracile TaxID=1884261 RepID=A0A5C3QPN0_9AGAR|nr:hypothetical protein BDV98DRAFT_591382 [Pterula gracilis]